MSEVAAQVETLEAPARRRRGRPSLLFAVCLLLFLGVVFLAIFGKMIAPQDPSAQDLSQVLIHPNGAHWLGTDALGRDVFSRLLVGARSALQGPFAIAAISMVLGNSLGLLAGYRGGILDTLLMRWVDFMLAVPALLVIIVIAGALGASYWLAVLVLAVLTVPVDARVVRGATIEQVPRPYVEAAKTLGVSHRRIMFLHIWPNVSPVAVANAFLIFAGSLVALSGLSFLGLGAAPGTPDWGQMLGENRALLFANPWCVLAPGAAIVITAASVNLLGDWYYEWIVGRGASR
ncbi:MAG TPA: ABC transporter permease [Gaiellaceae bacterium]|nr:ABC transporter permease [Gaiellaceae bacterium]